MKRPVFSDAGPGSCRRAPARLPGVTLPRGVEWPPGVRRDEPLAKHAAIGIGGNAALMAEPSTVGEVRRLLRKARRAGVPCLVLGAGSNILFSDRGFPGLVIKTAALSGITARGNLVTVCSGARLACLIGFGLKRNALGFEFLAGIPGTVGGALVMNAGAHGRSIADIVHDVTVLDDRLRTVTLSRREIAFRYRGSSLWRYPFVCAATLETFRGDRDAARREIGLKMRARMAGQPLGRSSAGSVFRNPPGDFAGRLIESAGCKGWREGGAQVSERHANFIVNTGKATARDVLRLIERVRAAVLDAAGVGLELEIVVVGNGTRTVPGGFPPPAGLCPTPDE